MGVFVRIDKILRPQQTEDSAISSEWVERKMLLPLRA